MRLYDPTHACAGGTLYGGDVSVQLGSAGERRVLQNHRKQRRDQRLQGRQVHVQLVFIQAVLALMGEEEDGFRGD